jgi:putative peptidoglycan lipid II flippase
MRIVIFGELLFIIGSFLSAILQSYNHFFIPGIAAALYNLGIIIGIVLLSRTTGIFSAAYGVIIGAFIFVLIQVPFLRKIGFHFQPSDFFKTSGIKEVFNLMWPRTISIAIFQLGILVTVTLISFLEDPGRNYVIFDYAQTLAFAPVVLFGQTIAQAAFPVLSRQKDNLNLFKQTFLTSFYEMMYLVLPISVLFLVLRIPIVRLIYGASQFDWPATVQTGRTLGIFSISLFAQALIYLVSRAYYALHDTKTPLIIGTISTIIMLILSSVAIIVYRSGFHQFVVPYGFFNGFWKGEYIINFGIDGIAASYTITSIFQFVLLFIILGKKTHGFEKNALFSPLLKIFFATLFTAFALYVPIKLLDRLVFDTTKTINLLILTGISSLAGLSLYIFLTWLFNVKEASTFLLIFKKLGNWREILGKTEETIPQPH